MARFAIGDVQGCYAALRSLLQRCGYRADRDQLWFVGDLVNRGPASLEVLRFVRSLGEGAVTVLGNHDLNLLAVAFGVRPVKSGDTIEAVLDAEDRESLLEWLIHQRLAWFDADRGDLLLHAGVIPQWSVAQVLHLAAEVESALQRDPRTLLASMYSNDPDRWSEDLRGLNRMRFVINTLTRMRICTADGRIDVKMKGKPEEARPPFRPWFEFQTRATADARTIFGHWSALGYVDTGSVLGVDTGCVWGGRLTARDLDSADPPVSVECRPSAR